MVKDVLYTFFCSNHNPEKEPGNTFRMDPEGRVRVTRTIRAVWKSDLASGFFHVESIGFGDKIQVFIPTAA